jgi:hypothetical protein
MGTKAHSTKPEDGAPLSDDRMISAASRKGDDDRCPQSDIYKVALFRSRSQSSSTHPIHQYNMPRELGTRIINSYEEEDYYPDTLQSVPGSRRPITQTARSAVSSPSTAPTSPITPGSGDRDLSRLGFGLPAGRDYTQALRQFQEDNPQMERPRGSLNPAFANATQPTGGGRFATTQRESDVGSADPSVSSPYQRRRPGPPPSSQLLSLPGGRGRGTALQPQTGSEYPTRQSGPGRSLLPSLPITERGNDPNRPATSRFGRGRGGSGPPPTQPPPPPPPRRS